MACAPLCIADKKDEVETNQKHEPHELVPRQEVPKCPSDDNNKEERDKKSLSEVNDQGEEEEVVKA